MIYLTNHNQLKNEYNYCSPRTRKPNRNVSKKKYPKHIIT